MPSGAGDPAGHGEMMASKGAGGHERFAGRPGGLGSKGSNINNMVVVYVERVGCNPVTV